jgi:hypothetical protein
MRTIPHMREADTPIMKRTLHEKLAPIPPAPEAPVTSAASLHPSHASKDGAQLINSAPSNEKNRSMVLVLFIFRLGARALRDFLFKTSSSRGQDTSSCVSRASIGSTGSQDIKNGKQENPNDIDEMPIQTGAI